MSPRLRLIVLLLSLPAIASAAAVLAAQVQPPAPVPPALTSCESLASALRPLANNDLRLRDWAQLGRYRQANATVSAPPDVVFMGDSITDSWPQPRFNYFQGKSYVGRGISGQTTPQMLIRMRPDVVALRPKVMVLLAGTNDIAGNTGPMTDEEIAGNISSMAEIAAANDIKVVLASILPTSHYHQGAAQTAPQTVQRPLARIRALNEWLRRYADEKGHVYLDYFSAMVDSDGLLRRELSADDLHPNEAGYAVMAPLADAAIARALSR
jgi:lysophospholipase L1-like esterase